MRAVNITAKYYGVPVDSLKTAQKQNNLPRHVTIYIFNNMSGWRLREIAEYFGVGYSAVSKSSIQIKRLLEKDKIFRKEVNGHISNFQT